MRASEEEKKQQALQKHNCWNPRWASVNESLFLTNDFFNAEDLVQVKYELLRLVREENMNVSEACKSFGLSRVRYYQILRDFKADGMAGLFPREKGPRRSHKLTDKVMEFIDQQIKSRQKPTSQMLAQALERELGVKIHSRSIERALARRKKKAPY